MPTEAQDVRSHSAPSPADRPTEFGDQWPTFPVGLPAMRASAEWQSMTLGNPVHLTAKSVVQPGSDGPVNSDSLVAPVDLLVNEIKFGVRVTLGSGSTNHLIFSGGVIQAGLVLGDHRLTKGEVPIWLFGPSQYVNNPFSAAQASVADGEEAWQDTVTFDLAYETSAPIHTPLFLRRGEVIVPTLGVTEGVIGKFTQNVTCYVSYSCTELVSGRPSRRTLPYWASWVSRNPFDPASTSANSDSSLETDLVNATQQDLRLLYLTGVTRALDQANNFEIGDGCGAFAAQLAQLQIQASDGSPVVPDIVGFRTLFSGLTRAWPCRGTMKPGEYLKAFLTVQAAAAGATAGTYQCSAHVGMHGEYDL